MSNTKGSLLISNANAVGTALVNKLGGTGYKPSEWSDAVNIMGIASADIPTALANITEGSYTGSERGSIKISNLNLVGSMLNKKFNTDRGFKPNEWESAISKLTPLQVKTASGSIASFTDGADMVPVKSCTVSFLPSGGGGTPSSPVAITGVSGVSVTQLGKNLIKPDRYQAAANNLTLGQTDNTSFSTFLKAGTYTISYATTGENCYIYRREANDGSNTNMGKATSKSFTINEDGNFRFWLYGDGATSANISNVQLEVGSTSTTYEAYKTPVVVTDTFGQTIYGGSRDLVTDKASVGWGYIASYNGETLTGRWVSSMDTYVAGTTPTTGAEVAYELATPTEITGLTPHEIDTLLGDNNFYAGTGDTSVEYRADIDLALNA